ncbi:hypothetical protein [Solicola gregarius]|uniref:Uncharacterized protein n=1 Tax=Solicola gregarius TaxID=2908642 RepID=A0AA46TJL6_9ACTN|nr:hypothetical protein [Solicola gregarius]UYM06047.1 hypothetical protein L0C25_02955 [Solicola gregarius]
MTIQTATTTPVVRPGASPLLAPLVMAWITVVLALDSEGPLWTQRLLGLLTWAILVAVLARESTLVRVQTAIVVCFASLIEYTFSPLLEVYVYRFDNVPAYVPPGHGLVYLSALALGRSTWVRAHLRACTIAVIGVGGTWALWGLFGTERVDALGAFWYACLVGFLLWGPSRSLYVGAFVVVSYLEIVGTGLGTWEWQSYDPTGIVAIGNPPSGAAGGYGWFDLAAILLAPVLIRWWRGRSAST